MAFNRNSVLGSLLGIVFFTALALGDFSLQNWQFEREIDVQPGAEFSKLIADRTLYTHSYNRLRDLRVMRSKLEVPYVIRTNAGKFEEIRLPVTIRNKVVDARRGLTAVLDLGSSQEHNRVRLESSEKNFKERVLVETGDDAKHWDLANEEGLIFDVSRVERQISDLTVSYPLSTRRYIRLTIPGWSNPAYLSGAAILRYKETAATVENVTVEGLVVSQDRKDHSTSYVVDAGSSGLPYDRLTIVPKDLRFSRVVEAFCSDDAETWNYAGGGALWKTQNQESLSLRIPEMWMRYAKLTIFNGDDQPLQIPEIQLSGLRRTILFPSAAAGIYTLFSGNSRGAKPSYDLEKTLPDSIEAAPAKLGAVKNNSEFQPLTKPWTDRNPMLLNSVLVVAVTAMLIVTWRYFRKAMGSK
jgi:hypothetical protein